MRVLGFCTGCNKPKHVRVRPGGLVGRRVVTGLCRDCEEREDRPSDLVILVPAPGVEHPIPPLSAVVGLSSRRVHDVSWEPAVHGTVATLAAYEAMLARAAERLLRNSAGQRASMPARDLVPVGVFDARRERIARICDRPALDRWLGRAPS